MSHRKRPSGTTCSGYDSNDDDNYNHAEELKQGKKRTSYYALESSASSSRSRDTRLSSTSSDSDSHSHGHESSESDSNHGGGGGSDSSSYSHGEDSLDNDNGNENPGEESSPNSSRDGSHFSREAIMNEFSKLTDAAQKLVNYIENNEDWEGSNAQLSRNIDEAQLLTNMLKSNDTTDSVTAFTHTLAVMKAARVSVKKCGRIDTNHFSSDKFLEALVNLSRDGLQQYDKRNAHKILGEARMHHLSAVENPLISLLGAISIQAPPEVVPPPDKEKVKKRESTKLVFSEGKSTQHEVVNSQAKDKNKTDNDNARHQSERKAANLQRLCSQRKKKSLSLVEYGLHGNATTARDFLKNVFDAAVITRDGFAQVTFPASEKHKFAKKYVPISDSQTEIQAAKPPQAASNASDEFDLNRFQQIVSFNARTIKKIASDSLKTENLSTELNDADSDDTTPRNHASRKKRKYTH